MQFPDCYRCGGSGKTENGVCQGCGGTGDDTRPDHEAIRKAREEFTASPQGQEIAEFFRRMPLAKLPRQGT